MKDVTKEEFEEFIANYPNKLEKDYYMDWWSWNDFSDGKIWPESMVAKRWDGLYNTPIRYQIKMTKKIDELREGDEFIYCGRIHTRGRKIPENPYVGYATFEGIRSSGSVLLFKGDTKVEVKESGK